MRILIVEDHADSGEVLAEFLELKGITVQVARGGEEALRLAPVLRPDAVLCDLVMPRMNGYAVLDALRQVPTLSHTRFIAVTGLIDPKYRQRSLEAGFEHHLLKPLDLPRLLRLVTQAPATRPKAGSKAPVRPSRRDAA